MNHTEKLEITLNSKCLVWDCNNEHRIWSFGIVLQLRLVMLACWLCCLVCWWSLFNEFELFQIILYIMGRGVRLFPFALCVVLDNS